jgi:hypothetical protein
MAEARAEVHVVAPQQSRRLLEDVVRFVGDPARGGEEAEAPRLRGADRFGGLVERRIPTNPPEARVTVPADHWEWDPAEVLELFVGELPQPLHARHVALLERRHRVHPQEPQPRRA